MSNGYLVAAEADLPAAREIGDGFGLEIIDASAVSDHDAIGARLADAANVGLMLSTAAAANPSYVALLQSLAQRLLRAQLIVVDDGARDAFAFLPTMWPTMSLDDARMRSSELVRRRQSSSDEETPHANPVPTPEPQPEVQQEAPQAPADADDGAPDLSGTLDAPTSEPETRAPAEAAPEPPADAPPEEPLASEQEAFGAGEDTPAPDRDAIADETPAAATPAPAEEAPAPPPAVSAPAPTPVPLPPRAEPPSAPEPQAPPSGVAGEGATLRKEGASTSVGAAAAPSAPADATAFAPKKLRRGTPELVRIVIHQPKDLQAVIKAARKIDPRTDPAPQGMRIGDVALGASVGVALEVRGATCDGALQRRTWAGDAIDFSFSVEADSGVKQVVLLARVFVDDAQIGVLAFTRNVSGPSKKPAGLGDRVRLKRHKRVFLSYSSHDRETVSAIATAYQMAGVEHFWDRASLKSGEEWSPRLRREIDRADLFHLCWSKSASSSDWVAKETEHALTRRRRNSGKPDITVQMLDGPPWAPHPAELDAINFDDFVRAAIVGYARGENEVSGQ